MANETNRKIFERNVRAFEEALPGILIENEGRFAVGSADDGFTCWNTYGDALQRGYETYGVNEGFIVQQIISPGLNVQRINYLMAA